MSEPKFLENREYRVRRSGFSTLIVIATAPAMAARREKGDFVVFVLLVNRALRWCAVTCRGRPRRLLRSNP